ncbi:RNA polymerase sigma factor [Actomonas aquatica]|uniref:Sigma-70 family RNA polymerase sigma factor n=1 Tax=Actomonas aquatica TaxID=2866162 RepID=A0ABZ1C297_9BACT|nr:sigma-70 family RNA polymerase sigma factor [Opitutus sp. WL0086]WRQ85813.1 sigma-70 family RNA polymerase sigma factor [Opitutus sp. WL0086]
MFSAASSPAARGMQDTDTAPPPEAELVREAQAGSESAARELVRLFNRPIYNYVVRMTGQVQDAEDITQDTFVKAFRALHKVDPDRPLINWLFTIARRTALNHFRGQKQWVELPEETLGDGADGPRREADLHERVDNLWAKARRVLNGREYEALWLRFGEELSTAETAAATGQTVPGIKTLIFRARQRLLAAKESFL